MSFFFWLLGPVQCHGKTFLYLIFWLVTLVASHILKQQRERLCNDDVNRASVL